MHLNYANGGVSFVLYFTNMSNKQKEHINAHIIHI